MLSWFILEHSDPQRLMCYRLVPSTVVFSAMAWGRDQIKRVLFSSLDFDPLTDTKLDGVTGNFNCQFGTAWNHVGRESQCDCPNQVDLWACLWALSYLSQIDV